MWVYDLDSQEDIATLTDGSRVYSVAFNPDGTILASGGRRRPSGSLRPGERYDFTKLHDRSAVEGLAFSPDGGFLASGDTAGQVLLYDRPAPRPPRSTMGARSRASPSAPTGGSWPAGTPPPDALIQLADGPLNDGIRSAASPSARMGSSWRAGTMPANCSLRPLGP